MNAFITLFAAFLLIFVQCAETKQAPPVKTEAPPPDTGGTVGDSTQTGGMNNATVSGEQGASASGSGMGAGSTVGGNTGENKDARIKPGTAADTQSGENINNTQAGKDGRGGDTGVTPKKKTKKK